ncbi:DUF1992 domain-containing protein [Rhodobacterales bacterium HKCCE2091]|nr:DUF1992 domain-containing protein [Rhodobacterales bacterium HKCCE2091]
MRGWERLTENRIRAAEAKGDLRGLAGEGKPLPARPEEAYIDAGTAIGHRIMAEAGALPEEILIRRELEAAREAYRAAKGTDGEKAAMARVAEVMQRLAIATEARKKFMG